MDGAKLAPCMCLVSTVLELPGEAERLVCVLPGLLAVSRQTADLTEPGDQERSLARTRTDIFADPLLHKRASLREAPLECQGIAQARHDRAQGVPVARGTTECQALLEHPDSRFQVPLGEVDIAEAEVDSNRCVASACQRGEAVRLFPMAPGLSESPDIAQGPCQPRPGLDLRVCAGRARLPVYSFHPRSQQLGHPAEVTEGIVDPPQAKGCLLLQGALAECGREIEGLLTCGNGAVRVSREPEDIGHRGQHSSQLGSIVERPSQGLSLAQQDTAPSILSQVAQRGCQSVPELDGQLQGVAGLGQMCEGLEGLLAVGYCPAERGAVPGPGAGLLAVDHGFVPHLSPQGMVRQPFDLLGPLVPRERFKRLDNPCMQRPPALQQKAPVSYLVRQGMLEGIFVRGRSEEH